MKNINVKTNAILISAIVSGLLIGCGNNSSELKEGFYLAPVQTNGNSIDGIDLTYGKPRLF